MILLIGAFGLGISAMLGLGVYFYGQMVAAKNSAIIWSRVTPGEGQVADFYAAEIPPERLARSVRGQRFLKDMPLIAPCAELLAQAGVKTTVMQFLRSTLLCSAMAGVLAHSVGCKPAPSVFAGLIGSGLPSVYYMRLRAKRLAAFEAQLVRILEMMTLYLRSGRSLPQAFVATAEEAEQPAHEELMVCAEEYRLGRPLPHALRGLAARYPELVGLKLLSIAVSVLGQTGGNLVEVLDRIRHTLEQSMTYVLKLRSLTGEARNSATLLGVTPGFSLLASAFLNPEYFNMFFDSTGGLLLLSFFLLLWLSGALWLRHLMGSKV